MLHVYLVSEARGMVQVVRSQAPGLGSLCLLTAEPEGGRNAETETRKRETEMIKWEQREPLPPPAPSFPSPC